MAWQGMRSGAASLEEARPTKRNPLNLNPLELRTLTLLQVIAGIPGAASQSPNGEVVISQFPSAHGDHFHLADATVSSKDASGLYNEAVGNALTRKGLAKAEWPHQMALRPEGLAYETAHAEKIRHKADH